MVAGLELVVLGWWRWTGGELIGVCRAVWLLLGLPRLGLLILVSPRQVLLIPASELAPTSAEQELTE